MSTPKTMLSVGLASMSQILCHFRGDKELLNVNKHCDKCLLEIFDSCEGATCKCCVFKIQSLKTHVHRMLVLIYENVMPCI